MKDLMACRPLFRRSGFLFILIALWPLTFFKHGYDGYHEASLVNSCAFRNDIAESKAVTLLLVRGTTIVLLSVLHVGKATSLRESTTTLVPSQGSI